MSAPPSKNIQGFSLPEVMIVVIIIAILVVLAVPQLNSSLQLNRIQTASSLIASKLSEAKMAAIKQNKQVSFVLDETNRQVWIEANSTVIGNVEQLPQLIKVKISPDTSATKEYITFNSMGVLSSTPATILPFYEAKRVELPISISISGKITLGAIRTY
ncbi:MAG TPA: GspH/FimT family pseudopilin [Pyrinomonadaceae bacterium]|nr:GspH/FimT family pseudopilin [Pyrinomonadaceae bacterium]